MIDLYFANIGTGKTTLLAKIAKKELKRIEKGKSIYEKVVSNAPINGVHYVRDLREILKTYALQNCLILIDEASIDYNNRMMKMTAEEIEYFKLIRHYHSKIVLASQSHEDIDITLRRLYTNMYVMYSMPFQLTLIKPIVKKIDIDPDTKQITELYRFSIFLSYKWLFRPLYYHMFNSYWKPDRPIYEYNMGKDFEYDDKKPKVSIKERIRIIGEKDPKKELTNLVSRVKNSLVNKKGKGTDKTTQENDPNTPTVSCNYEYKKVN